MIESWQSNSSSPQYVKIHGRPISWWKTIVSQMYEFLPIVGLILRWFGMSPDVNYVLCDHTVRQQFWCTMSWQFDSGPIKNNWHFLLHAQHTTVYKDPWITIMDKMVRCRSIVMVLSDWIDVLSSWTRPCPKKQTFRLSELREVCIQRLFMG